MKIRPNQAAILCCLGLFAASSVPVGAPADGQAGILSAVLEPLRMIQREAAAQNQTSPSHVYQLVSDLQSEIEILREAMGVTDYPLEAEPVEDRSPIHVYAKTLELRRKISAAQKRLGMAPAKVGLIPVKTIRPKDVHGSVQAAVAEIRRTKEQLVIEDQIEPTPFEGGKTPSLVYQHVADASFMLDGLVGHPTDISDVYRNLISLQGELELVATKLKVALELDPPESKQRRRLKDVGQQILRATFKLIKLQTRLGMDSSGVPEVSLVRVTPAEINSAVNNMQAELVRIKVHLGITLPRDELRRVAQNKRPRDVFAVALQIIRNLGHLAKGVDAYVENQG